MLVTEDGTIQFISRTLPQFKPEDVIGTNVADYLSKEDARKELAAIKEVFETGKPRVIELSSVGNTYWQSRIHPLTDSDGSVVAVMIISTDLTEQKRLEKRLKQSQQLEAIGLLAGSVAHDFNNLLGAISGYTELALKHAEPGSSVADYLGHIKEATSLSKSITGQLLSLSRKDGGEKKLINLNESVRAISELLRMLLGEIELTLNLSSETGCIYADSSRIQQVVLNLAVNARDAMPAGGKLNITTDRIETAKSPLQNGNSDGCVLLEIQDNGEGIPDGIQDKIFEPFFTTKQSGKGTGLGLSIVKEIVEAHGGRISVTSRPGQGTTFSCYFPAAKAQAAETDPKEPDELSRSRALSILVVEDNEMIQMLLEEYLSDEGHAVFTAKSSEEALKLIDEKNFHADILVSDILLPGISGIELYRLLKQRTPKLAAVFMSGDSRTWLDSQIKGEPDTAFIQKPFSLAKLSEELTKLSDHSEQ